MPNAYAPVLTGRQRTLAANRQFGFVLAFVAGAINAGGFLAVRQYTSYVTDKATRSGAGRSCGPAIDP